MIHAVILAGGWGKRFWPKSRRKLPKQLLCLTDKHSSIQSLFNKIKSEIPKERIWVVTNKKYGHILRRHLPFLSQNNFLVEPLAKNTACAIGWASMTIKRTDPQAVTLVLSSDHMLGQKNLFLKTIKQACLKAEEEDVLVTIGIRTHRAAVEYGYLKIARSPQPAARSLKTYKVEKFVEKPDIKKARAYLKSRNYLWNSGIFVWKANTILQAIKKHLPQIYFGLQRIEKAQDGPEYKKQLVREYSRFKDISIDYGVMEKAQNIYTVVGDFPWADIGTWASLCSDFLVKDAQGNVIRGLCKGIDTFDSVIFSEQGHLIATLGVHNLIIVHTPTATLVCKKDQAQEVKKLTELLEKDKRFKKYL